MSSFQVFWDGLSAENRRGFNATQALLMELAYIAGAKDQLEKARAELAAEVAKLSDDGKRRVTTDDVLGPNRAKNRVDRPTEYRPS